MRDRFWSLSGPRRLLEFIRNALLGGESVVLRVPPWAPDPLEPLANLLPPHRAFRELDDAMSAGRDPGSLLREALDLEPGLSLEACAPAHAEPIAAVRGPSGERARLWARFLRRHNHATRERNGAVRILLLLSADCLVEPADLGAVPVRDWKDVVGRLDMHLYAAELWSSREMVPLERDLCVALTREVARWCPELAERLAEAGSQAAFEPMPILLDMARERGWTCDTAPRWEIGTQDRQDGMKLCHAALAAVRGDHREIGRRIWRAQIDVLYPRVEQIRAHLALQYHDLLLREAGLAGDPVDLDVGPLASHLDAARGVRRSDRRLANAIRGVRHSLAHLRPVPRETALQPALLEALERGLELA